VARKQCFDRAQLRIIWNLLAQDASPTSIAEAAEVSRQVVYRVQDDPAKAEAMLAEWGM
jgi:putative DNA-invertase from lambdoid prophage Rac